MPDKQTLDKKHVSGLADARNSADGDHMSGAIRPSGPSLVTGDARQDAPKASDEVKLGNSGWPSADKGFIKHPY